MGRVRPHGTFKNGFDLLDDAGRVLGSFQGSAWRERGDITAPGELGRFRRDGGRRFVLDGRSGELAVAERPSLWSGRWVLHAGDRSYELTKRSWLSRAVELRRGGQVVGAIGPRGAFSGKAAVDLPAELPPLVQVFVVAVVLTLWRRESAAAGAAAATGGATATGSA